MYQEYPQGKWPVACRGFSLRKIPNQKFIKVSPHSCQSLAMKHLKIFKKNSGTAKTPAGIQCHRICRNDSNEKPAQSTPLAFCFYRMNFIFFIGGRGRGRRRSVYILAYSWNVRLIKDDYWWSFRSVTCLSRALQTRNFENFLFLVSITANARRLESAGESKIFPKFVWLNLIQLYESYFQSFEYFLS